MCTVCSQSTTGINDPNSSTFGLSARQYAKLVKLGSIPKKKRSKAQCKRMDALALKANKWSENNNPNDEPPFIVTTSSQSTSKSRNREPDHFDLAPGAEKGKKNKKGKSSGSDAGSSKPDYKYSKNRLEDFLESGSFSRSSYDGMDRAAKFALKETLKRFGDYFYQTDGHHGIRGTPSSEPWHGTGQAFDLMVPGGASSRGWSASHGDSHMGNNVARFTAVNADALGVKYIIWNNKIWNASIDSASKAKDPTSWRGYTGSHPHTDHLHINTWDNTSNFGKGKIVEPAGGSTKAKGNNSGNDKDVPDSPDGADDSKNDVRKKMKPYKKGSARRSFANTLVARLGFSEEDARTLADSVKKAENQDEAMGLIYGSDIYKERFKGNELRKEKGLPPIPEAQYVALERQYGEILAANGVSSDVFDSEDYAVWMANDISAAEITERVSEYGSIVNEQWDDSMKDAMKRLYGMSDSDFLAFAMKPTEGTLQKLKRRVRALEIADAAIEEGFESVLGRKKSAREWAERLAQSGSENIDPQSVFSEQRRWNETGGNAMQKALGFNERGQREQIEDQMGVPGQTGMSESDRRRKMRRVMSARGRGSGGSGINAAGDESFDTSF